MPDPKCMAKIERVQVKYSIGIVHEYSNSIQLFLDYPVEVPEAPDIKTWPALPPYHTPFTYIREKFRRDMVALDVHAFRGEEGQQLLENVTLWILQAFFRPVFRSDDPRYGYPLSPVFFKH